MIRLRLAFITAAALVVPMWGATAQSPRGASVVPADSGSRHASFAPSPEAARELPSDLVERLRGDLFNFFRFVNKAWAQRVCDQFATELPGLPAVQLHGDAHIEQYAVTESARGLDDFDDSARGPSVIDLVRFLGSIEVVARLRGWQGDLDRLFDEFFAGYRKGLEDPRFLPPEPAVVPRLRVAGRRERPEFLAWADSLMSSITPEEYANVEASLTLFGTLAAKLRPEFVPGYFKLKKAGWLHMGVGSALTKKALLRVEGLTASPNDDVILEAKQLSDLRGVACLDVPRTGEVFRVINGAEQMGRIRHDILAVVPRRDDREVRDWYVRNWDATYAEVRVSDLQSASEFAEVVRDAGAQLGATNLTGASPMLERQLRQAEIDAVTRLEPRIRAVSHQITNELVDSWEQLKKQ